MPFTVKIEPNSTQQQASVIPDVSPNQAGLMTPEMLAKLNGITPGAGLAIGDPIDASTPGNVLFVGALADLSQSPFFTFDPGTATLETFTFKSVGIIGTVEVGSHNVIGTYDPFIRYQPVEAAQAPFEIGVTRGFNPAAPPDDWVAHIGWNVNQAIVAQPYFQLTIEASYNNQTEFYIASAGAFGAGTTRPFSMDVDHATGVTVSAFNAGLLKLQDAPGGATSWTWHLHDAVPGNSGYVGITMPTSGISPIIITGPAAGTPQLKFNGCDILRNDGATGDYVTHIGQDNTDTQIGQSLIVGDSAVGHNLQGGKRLLWLQVASVIPAGNPANGMFIYVDPADNIMKARGSGGTITPLALP